MIRKIMLKLQFPEVSSKTPVEQWEKESHLCSVFSLAADLFCDHGMHPKATVCKAAQYLNTEMSISLVAKSF